MIRVSQVKLNLEESQDILTKKVAKKLRINEGDIVDYRIYKESIDARKKDAIQLVYTLDVNVKNQKKILKQIKDASLTPDLRYKCPEQGSRVMKHRPVIIGFGPAGMFAGLILSQQGYKPLILERGQAVKERTVTIEEFWNEGILNENSNVQFGEGGAGTFSDGKLTTRIKDPRCRKVLEAFCEAGAPEEIMYKNKPHIGTDILKKVVENIRETIVAQGGEVRFDALVEEILVEEDQIAGVKLSDGEVIPSQNVILAIGHSARDTFEEIKRKGIKITSKPFAIGVRIEHPQVMIDKVQYSDHRLSERLGAAEYHLTYQTTKERPVYTFCMCPGGVVVGASSEKNTVVTNGMSEYARDKANANSALLVGIKPEDFAGEDPLRGMYFQRELEQKAFEVGGHNYFAPAQRVGDFLAQRATTEASISESTVEATYRPGVKYTDMTACLPEFITEALREGIENLDKKLKGFSMEEAIITAVETRTSSPIRIVRDEESLESINTTGLFPCGEGAGYAGGIMSSAVDGIKVAEKIIQSYKVLKG